MIGIEPEDNTDTPYLAFGIGDTVTAPDQTGADHLPRGRHLVVGG